MTQRIYGVKVSWEYQIITARHIPYELLPNSHIAEIKRKILLDFATNSSVGVKYAGNICAALKAIIYNGINFYSRSDTDEISLEFGDATKQVFSFPDQIVLGTSGFQLPKRASFTGKAVSTIINKRDGKDVKVVYISKFSEFITQEIELPRALTFLNAFPGQKVKAIVDKKFVKMHHLEELVSPDYEE
ncbi:TPA_asm: M [Tagetes erecta virus 1]|uniref:M n=1 Tax=Tagetes erecta virus 1 TaxID=2793742 RepID=A0A8D9UJ29_9RHAB|nr:M [Tagetes erecta virus 1] [Tagetes erecta virus 1]DAF42349.1 TPA_asm: M [Tagetes erecta virus 1]